MPEVIKNDGNNKSASKLNNKMIGRGLFAL